jgi:hypothetical protein
MRGTRSLQREPGIIRHLLLVTRHCLTANSAHTFLINGALIRNLCNLKKTNNGGHF